MRMDNGEDMVRADELRRVQLKSAATVQHVNLLLEVYCSFWGTVLI